MMVVLYIGNLPLDTTADEVAPLVEPLAQVKSIVVEHPGDLAAHARARVEAVARHAESALAALREARLRGCRLIVQRARTGVS